MARLCWCRNLSVASLSVVCVGKLGEAYLREAAAEYHKRIQVYTKLHLREVAEERLPRKPSGGDISRALSKESERLLAAVPDGAHVVALAIDGQGMSSENFSEFMAARLGSGQHSAFLIGSSFGLSPLVLGSAHTRLSLSHMTLPHQLARIILLEQIYRALNSINGGRYHK